MAKAKQKKRRRGKVKRLRCGMIVTFLASKSGTPGDQFPGRYYGARKRRRQRHTDKMRHVALHTA